LVPVSARPIWLQGLRAPPQSRVARTPGQTASDPDPATNSLLVGQAPPSPDAYLQALREAAEDDFASMSSTPPLLYHNNLSAVPPHYHWSEDFGYALWLRLYVETARRWSEALSLASEPPKTP
jgi:hypothetical protein